VRFSESSFCEVLSSSVRSSRIVLLSHLVDFELVRLLELMERRHRIDATLIRHDGAREPLQLHVCLTELVVRHGEQRILVDRGLIRFGSLLELLFGHEVLAGAIELHRLKTALFVNELSARQRWTP
jgi:hypothetical protein